MHKLLFIGDTTINKMMFTGIEEVRCEDGFCSKSIINRCCRRILPLVGLSLGKWKGEVSNYDCIVISEQSYRKGLAEYLLFRGAKRLVLYLRNSMASVNSYSYKIDLQLLKRLGVEIWSYNLPDCRRYGYHYNSQFYALDLPKSFANNKIKYDLVFMGDEKGRDKILSFVYKFCDEHAINTCFNVTESDAIYNMNKSGVFIPYKDYLENILNRSKAVLDVVTDMNYGLTLRPLEALYFRKKLVTNFKDIKGENFYSKENIFILGDDDLSILKEFIESPFTEISQKILDQYTSKAWYQKFFE